MKDYKYHYVYRITNTVTEMHYYGDRSCDCHQSEDIGFKYFSTFSNKFFKIDQQLNSQDYKYKVIKIFETRRDDAKQLEVDLHKRFDVKNHPKFINRANQTSKGFSTLGRITSERTKLKLRTVALNRKLSESTKIKISQKISIIHSKNKEFWRDKRQKEILKNSVIGNDGLTELQRIGRKSAETRKKTIDKNSGLTLQALCNYNQSTTKKGISNPKNSGAKSGRAKIIKVYDLNDDLIFEAHGNLQKCCDKFNILSKHLSQSYNNDSKIIKYSFTKRNRYKNINGWWAEICER